MLFVAYLLDLCEKNIHGVIKHIKQGITGGQHLAEGKKGGGMHDLDLSAKAKGDLRCFSILR